MIFPALIPTETPNRPWRLGDCHRPCRDHNNEQLNSSVIVAPHFRRMRDTGKEVTYIFSYFPHQTLLT